MIDGFQVYNTGANKDFIAEVSFTDATELSETRLSPAHKTASESDALSAYDTSKNTDCHPICAVLLPDQYQGVSVVAIDLSVVEEHLTQTSSCVHDEGNRRFERRSHSHMKPSGLS